MTATTHPTVAGSPDLAGMTLDAAQIVCDQITALEVQKFQYAVLWVDLHPGDQVDTTVAWQERDLEIAGDGAPTFAEFAIADFALALSMSTDAARTYLGDAVETCYRLPRLWTRVSTGQVPVWKARRIAQATKSLPIQAASFVDREVAPVAHRCSYAQIDRTVENARARFDPDQVEADRAEKSDQRHLDLDFAGTDITGLVHLTGLLDLADALALEAVIAAKAHDLLSTHPVLPLDVRRSMAAGHLGDNEADGAGRELVIYTHHDSTSTHGLVRVENTRSWITTEQLADWCQTTGTRVTIRPVLDLTANLRAASYTPTDRQREQAVLRHPTCVFPHCTRPSRGLDLDHIVEWALGGLTESWNLAPLCRGHHRLKTFAGWTYRRTGPTTFEWTDPRGNRYRST